MEVYIGENKLVIITEPRSISFNLTNKADNSLKHKIDSIIKHNEFLNEERM